jgi:lipopolysaccharide transport system ATP-binding protein
MTIGKLRSDELRVVRSEGDEHGKPLGKPAQAVTPVDQHTLAIEISDATLQYPIRPFVRGSLKASIFGLVGRKEAIPPPEFVEAIKSLNLSIRMGERLGIIGSNGSGKSSLLRVMAGIYPLKSGSIQVVGQIGTLLDIGLGFESESTGRENIYYRGMAMGYSRKEIADAEAEIIEFAGLGDFINLPMRTYSSGMYVRLAFAVSTQFRPDVLLIDEVFGAGDAAFADKALKRMFAIVESAGIVVLATHDLALVERLCTRVLWLNRGVVERDGPPSVVLPHFMQFMSGDLTINESVK